MIDISRILCPIDFSTFSERALMYAMRMAVWYNARLRVVHVMPPPAPLASGALQASSRERVQRNLAAAVERTQLKGVTVDTALIESVDPVTSIIEAAETFDAGVIVTGSHGQSGIHRIVLGSVVDALLHRSARPVMAIPSHLPSIPADRPLTFERIVCAVDFSAASLNALAHALAIAEETAAQLTLLHVIEEPHELLHAPEAAGSAERARVDAEARALTRLHALVPEQAREYCTVETAVLEGFVSQQLLRMAADRNADLIVIGVHGRNALDLVLFGSNSKEVLRQAHCPVLIVPSRHHNRLMRAAS